MRSKASHSRAAFQNVVLIGMVSADGTGRVSECAVQLKTNDGGDTMRTAALTSANDRIDRSM